VTRRNVPWAKSVHPNLPGKKHKSGFGLPPIIVFAKINKKSKKKRKT